MSGARELVYLCRELKAPSLLAGVERLAERVDHTPDACPRARGCPAHRGLTGRRWIILKGGNREGVLMSISSRDELWGFEGLQCGERRR